MNECPKYRREDSETHGKSKGIGGGDDGVLNGLSADRKKVK